MRITQIFPVDADRCTDMALLNERLTRKEQRLAFSHYGGELV